MQWSDIDGWFSEQDAGFVSALESWRPKVRPGGALAGHDYSDSRRFTVRPAAIGAGANGMFVGRFGSLDR